MGRHLQPHIYETHEFPWSVLLILLITIIQYVTLMQQSQRTKPSFCCYSTLLYRQCCCDVNITGGFLVNKTPGACRIVCMQCSPRALAPEACEDPLPLETRANTSSYLLINCREPAHEQRELCTHIQNTVCYKRTRAESIRNNIKVHLRHFIYMIYLLRNNEQICRYKDTFSARVLIIIS